MGFLVYFLGRIFEEVLGILFILALVGAAAGAILLLEWVFG